jgi:hypothetical protein
VVTLLHAGAVRDVDATPDGEALWLNAADAETATGWALKPEGLCREEVCVPIAGAAAGLVRGTMVDLAGFWRHLGRAVLHDASGETWLLGTSGAERREQLRSLRAPDFALPDLAGRVHRLHDYAGRKILLASWASW